MLPKPQFLNHTQTQPFNKEKPTRKFKFPKQSKKLPNLIEIKNITFQLHKYFLLTNK